MLRSAAMRIHAALLVAITASACELSPPCQQVAKAVCDVGREGDSCAFLLAVPRGDASAQRVCEGVLATAKALQQAPSDPRANAEWALARARLVTLGFAADARKGRIDEKLKAAGGEAGRLVDKAERVMDDAEKIRTEQAERAFDAVNQ